MRRRERLVHSHNIYFANLSQEMALLRSLNRGGTVPDIEYEVPIRVEDGWLEIELASLARDALVDIGELLRSANLLRWLRRSPQ